MANSSSRYSVLTAAHWGPMLVETDGETVFSSRGALATGMENSLQSAVRDQVHSNTRVRFPMVRKGFLASPENPQGIRGQDEFVRVSWDEALDLIHQQHKRIREAYGPASILLVPTAGVQTACCIRPRHYYNAIWRWQAVIPGIWGIIRPARHRRSCRMSWVVVKLSTADQLAAGAGT
ncbi:biotin sulfoxide reductase [Escherichia coli]|nr:biotin sulfoxide reductase [Escherichia coli]